MQLLILADDFTGALDTAVSFASYGKTHVTMDIDYDFSARSDVQVLVINTETRPLEPKEAASRIRCLVRRAKAAGVPYLYKKTDSALRGNVGAELEAALLESGAAALPLLQSLPAAKRIVQGGRLYIGGVPVHESVFGKDPFDPVRHDEVARIIGDTSDVPVAACASVDAMAMRCPPPSVWVIDAADNQALHRAGQTLKAHHLLSVTAGCAGFATLLPTLLDMRESQVPIVESADNLAVICGSINDISQAQIEDAVRQGFARLTLTHEQKLTPEYWETDEGRAWLDGLVNRLEKGSPVILDTFDAGGQSALHYAAGRGIDKSELRKRVSASLGELGRSLLEAGFSGTLMITGGDTLMGFMRAINCRALEPVREVAQGTVLSRFTFRDQVRQLISKSGGFGEADVFSRAARVLGIGMNGAGTVDENC